LMEEVAFAADFLVPDADVRAGIGCAATTGQQHQREEEKRETQISGSTGCQPVGDGSLPSRTSFSGGLEK